MVTMKALMQLSIKVELKSRLENFKKQTGIPFSQVIETLLEKHLPKLEKKHGVQMLLGLRPKK